MVDRFSSCISVYKLVKILWQHFETFVASEELASDGGRPGIPQAMGLQTQTVQQQPTFGSAGHGGLDLGRDPPPA